MGPGSRLIVTPAAAVLALDRHLWLRHLSTSWQAYAHDKRLTDRVDGTNMESHNGLYQDLGWLHTLLR